MDKKVLVEFPLGLTIVEEKSHGYDSVILLSLSDMIVNSDFDESVFQRQVIANEEQINEFVDHEGDKLVHIACCVDNTTALKILVEHGASYTYNHEYKTPLDVCIEFRSICCFQIVFKFLVDKRMLSEAQAKAILSEVPNDMTTSILKSWAEFNFDKCSI